MMMMMMMNPSGKVKRVLGWCLAINWNVVSWKEDGSMQNPPSMRKDKKMAKRRHRT